VAKHDCDGWPAKSGSRENAGTEVVLPKKENGTDLHQCRSRPRILRVLAVLPRLFSAAGWSTYLRWCPRPRDAKVSPIFYPNRLPASIRFRVPWTWAIPNELGSAIASQCRMLRRGGNPKLGSFPKLVCTMFSHTPRVRTFGMWAQSKIGSFRTRSRCRAAQPQALRKTPYGRSLASNCES
jgi:hypothetical protein